MKPTWKTYLLYVSLTIVGVIVFGLLVETIRLKNTGFEGKTLWEWMELLIIPIFLAMGAFYLERSERAVEHQIADERTREDRKIAEDRIKEDRNLADDRAKLDRDIAAGRQQEAALQAYLDRMAELLLERDLRTIANEEVRNVARIRTLTVLRVLDKTRKGLVVRFLYESGLIAQEPIINLTGGELYKAELRKAKLSETNLSGTSLYRADLMGADLSGADLSQADLSGAELLGAHLKGASLKGADLRGARLNGADLGDADLSKAEISDEQIATAKSLKGATMPDGTIHD